MPNIVIGTARGASFNSGIQYNSGMKYNTSRRGFTGTGGLLGEGVRVAVGGALLTGMGDLTGEGEATKTYRVVYELTFGPTTLGLNSKEKRARKLFLIISKADNARMYVAYATSRDGVYTAEVPVGGSEALSRAKKILPLVAGNPAGGYIYRVRIRGWGEATVHEIVFAVSPRRGNN